MNDLNKISLDVRKKCIDMAARGGCFLGASLSCTDILVYLYFKHLRIKCPSDADRDVFFLSKGHDVPALYATMCERGFFEAEVLDSHLSPHSNVYWHPSRSIPGVEFHSGSLGHIPSIAAGMAQSISSQGRRVVALLGDGELNEGSVWEAFMFCRAYSIGNICFVVDKNGFQANGRTTDILNIEPIEEKLKQFIDEVYAIDGHSYSDLDNCFSSLDYANGRPKVVIANTLRGKGLASIENKADNWFCTLTSTEATLLKQQLTGSQLGAIRIKKEIVR